MTRAKVIWVIVAALGILSALSVPRPHSQAGTPTVSHHVEAHLPIR